MVKNIDLFCFFHHQPTDEPTDGQTNRQNWLRRCKDASNKFGQLIDRQTNKHSCAIKTDQIVKKKGDRCWLKKYKQCNNAKIHPSMDHIRPLVEVES